MRATVSRANCEFPGVSWQTSRRRKWVECMAMSCLSLMSQHFTGQRSALSTSSSWVAAAVVSPRSPCASSSWKRTPNSCLRILRRAQRKCSMGPQNWRQLSVGLLSPEKGECTGQALLWLEVCLRKIPWKPREEHSRVVSEWKTGSPCFLSVVRGASGFLLNCGYELTDATRSREVHL